MNSRNENYQLIKLSFFFLWEENRKEKRIMLKFDPWSEFPKACWVLGSDLKVREGTSRAFLHSSIRCRGLNPSSVAESQRL